MIDEVAAITILDGEDLTVSNLGAGNTLYLLGWFLTNVAQEDLSGFLGEIAQRIDSFQARSVLERNLFAEEIDQLPISFLLS